VPERIDYPRLAVHTRLLGQAVSTVAGLPDRGHLWVPGRPQWRALPEPSVEEVRSILSIVTRAQEKADEWKVTPAQAAMLGGFRALLQGTVSRGVVGRGERAAIRNAALRLFAEAQGLQPR
jgi:hypothetical protein